MRRSRHGPVCCSNFAADGTCSCVKAQLGLSSQVQQLLPCGCAALRSGSRMRNQGMILEQNLRIMPVA